MGVELLFGTLVVGTIAEDMRSGGYWQKHVASKYSELIFTEKSFIWLN